MVAGKVVAMALKARLLELFDIQYLITVVFFQLGAALDEASRSDSVVSECGIYEGEWGWGCALWEGIVWVIHEMDKWGFT